MATSMTKVRRVPLEWEKRPNYLALVIDNVFTAEECNALMDRSEKEGYEQALVNIGGGRQQKMDDFRNNDRCIIDDPQVAQKLWERILEAIETLDDETKASLRIHKLYQPESGWTAVGLNERLRILRYRPGAYFKPHFDGSYMRGYEAGVDRKGEESFVTCQLYLNEDFEGGETTFMSLRKMTLNQQSFKVVPKTGSVLLFQHDLGHEGSLVTTGQKYAMRTDVMYTTEGPGHEYSVKPIVLGGPSASDSFEESMEIDN